MTAVAVIAVVVVYVYFLLIEFLVQEIKASEKPMDVVVDRWQTPREPNEPEVNVLALVKGTERYVFIYTDECRADTLRTLARYASDPGLSFTWYDAALLSQRLREDRITAA